MKQNQDAITQKRANFAENGMELSEDLNTIRITARFLPNEWDDLTDEEMEDMTLKEVEQERKRKWEYSWKWFVSRLTYLLQRAGLHKAVYLSNPMFQDMEYRDFSDFEEAYLVHCEESGAAFGESEWDETMGVKLVSWVPKEIIVDEDHPYLSARDGVLFNKDQTELLWYPYGKEGETYTIPNGVTKISYRAFAGYMTTVAMRKQDGSRVERLWRRVFHNLIDGGMDTEYEIRPASVVKYVFNRNLRHVIMPDTVTVIDESAFNHCIFLNSVKLSNALEEIGSDAFKGCKEMREISLPDSLERLIAQQQYYYHRYRANFFPDNLERVNFLGTRCRLQPIITNRAWKSGWPDITEPYTTKFFSEIFRSGKDVTITFEAGNERFSSESGVIFNKDRTELIYCPKWKSGVYTVPKTVVRFGREAFAECGGLTRVIFSGSAVTDIGDKAFFYCKALWDIDLRSIKHIGDRAFTGCNALTRINLHSVEHIGNEAFSDCTALDPTITIPRSCRCMSSSAFSHWKRLTTSLKSLRVPRETEVICPDNASPRRWDDKLIPEIDLY